MLLLPPTPSATRLSLLLSLSVLRKHLLSLRKHSWHVAGTCVAREHAYVRYAFTFICPLGKTHVTRPPKDDHRWNTVEGTGIVKSSQVKCQV